MWVVEVRGTGEPEATDPDGLPFTQETAAAQVAHYAGMNAPADAWEVPDSAHLLIGSRHGTGPENSYYLPPGATP